MKGRARVMAAAGLVAGVLVLGAAPAHAELEEPCQATGSFREGTDAAGPFEVDAAAVGSRTVTVPRADSVEWSGSVTSPPGGYDGNIAVDLPAPFGSVAIDSWEGTTDQTSNTGVEDYDLPALVPSGVKLRVVGHHADSAQSCSGFVNVVIEGGPFKSPAAPAVALMLTLLAAGGFAAAVWPVFRRA